ncbi:hypothetical protein N0V88_007072 [Collariella sp. IMI 366227]|nr:hypothetical protein N0V88_007072 [Collariella sp. IMI 366227]
MADSRQSPSPKSSVAAVKATDTSASPASPATAEQQPGSGQQSPPEVSPNAGILPASHWQPLDPSDNDADSALGDSQSATTSLKSTIYQYRTFNGRTYHGDLGSAESWTPNDERHLESMDMAHHVAELMLNGKLHLAPLEHDKIRNVIDIGTGTGMWAVDFADTHPGAEVLGTDVTPIQSTWLPPNCRFEIDDANRSWVHQDELFDYIHIRFLIGNIGDWDKFYSEAFRCCKPGGWIEHQEPSFLMASESSSPITEDSPMGQLARVFWEGGRKFGRTFRIYEDDIQRKGMEAAGFTDITVKDIKIPTGGWPSDPKLKSLGEFSDATFVNDLEGYLNYMCNAIMGWSPVETQVYCAHLRRQLRQPGVNPYFIRRIVYGRKPE